MTQGMNLQRIEKFVNWTQLYIICEKSGLRPAPSGTRSYGRQAGWLAGWLADKIWVRLEILKTCCRSKYSIFHFFSQGTALFQQL